MTRERIGYIGLGNIGAPMAERIAGSGFPLTVFNRTPSGMKPLKALGAIPADSPAALTRFCDIICLCVTDAAAVETVVFGPDGVAAHGAPEKLLVDLSTVHPSDTQGIAARLREQCGMGWVDAPVSGGPAGARAGTLAAMVGGDATDVERARPVLMTFAGKVTHMGPTGCGQATKACNQMINYGTTAIISEAMNFAARFGMNPSMLPDALAGGFADSSILRNYGPKLADGSFSGTGNSHMTMKDMEIVLDLGRRTGSAMPLVSLLASFYRMLMARGHTADGLPGIARMYADPPLNRHHRASGDENE